MATKRTGAAHGRSTPATPERRVLTPKAPRVDVRGELIARPAVVPGLYRRKEVGRRLTVTELRAVVASAGYKTMGGGGGASDVHVELSPGVPWVDGRGWLEAAGMLQAWFGTGSASFIPSDPSKEQGVLSIWLDGLTPGDAYIAQIRVGGYPVNPQVSGTYNIGASDAAHADIHHTGASQTLTVLMPGVSGALSLINVETKGLGGWLFDDVIVTHVGPLS
jgi:hypothetical protein